MKRRIEATVFGHVQGVFFRDTTKKRADALGITGWVRNERDGSVRVVAEGQEEALRNFERFLHEGPPRAHVRQVDTNWQKASDEFGQFSVRY